MTQPAKSHAQPRNGTQSSLKTVLSVHGVGRPRKSFQTVTETTTAEKLLAHINSDVTGTENHRIAEAPTSQVHDSSASVMDSTVEKMTTVTVPHAMAGTAGQEQASESSQVSDWGSLSGSAVVYIT